MLFGRIIKRLLARRAASQKENEAAEIDVAGTGFEEMHQYEEPIIKNKMRIWSADKGGAYSDLDPEKAVDLKKVAAIISDKNLQSILQISCQFDKIIDEWVHSDRTLEDMFDEKAKWSAVKAAVSLSENYLDDGFVGSEAQSSPPAYLTVKEIVGIMTVDFVPNLLTGDEESPSPVIALKGGRPGRKEEEASKAAAATAAEDEENINGPKDVDGGNHTRAVKRHSVGHSCRFCAQPDDKYQTSKGRSDSTGATCSELNTEEVSETAETEDECDECDAPQADKKRRVGQEAADQ